MTRAILDPNVLISALLFGGIPRDVVERAERGRFEIIASEDLLTELGGVLHHPKFQRLGLTDAVIDGMLLRIRRVSTVTAELIAVPDFKADPKDTHLLALATTTSADYLVTGDNALLELGNYAGTRIITTRAFLALLDQEPPQPPAA